MRSIRPDIAGRAVVPCHRVPMHRDAVFLAPVFALLSALIGVHVLGLDIRLADFLYQREGNEWALRHAWLTADILHEGSQRLSILIGVLTLTTIIASCFVAALKPYTRGLVAVFVAAITSLLLVGLSKHQLPLACPYDLQRYGGDLAGHAVFNLYWREQVSGCFPAGHAAGGYCFLVWFFFARHYRLPGYRYAVWPGITLGLINGIDQQLRGAHFLSHDLSAILLCWTVGYLVFRLVMGDPTTRVPKRA